MKTRTYTTVPAFYGGPVTTYRIIPEKMQGAVVYALEVTTQGNPPQRLNSLGRPCSPVHRLFEFKTARVGLKKHNRENGNGKIIEVK